MQQLLLTYMYYINIHLGCTQTSICACMFNDTGGGVKGLPALCLNAPSKSTQRNASGPVFFLTSLSFCNNLFQARSKTQWWKTTVCLPKCLKLEWTSCREISWGKKALEESFTANTPRFFRLFSICSSICVLFFSPDDNTSVGLYPADVELATVLLLFVQAWKSWWISLWRMSVMHSVISWKIY